MKKLVALVLAFVLCTSSAFAAEFTVEEASKFYGRDLSVMTQEELETALEHFRGYVKIVEGYTKVVENLLADLQAREEIDYTALSREDAFAAIAPLAEEGAKYGEYVTRSIDTRDSQAIIIEVDMEGYTESGLLASTVQYVCIMAEAAFTRDDFDTLYFRFFEPGRDAKGNAISMMTMTVRLTKETADEMDLQYFAEYAPAQKQAFFAAVDGYSVHKDYKKYLK